MDINQFQALVNETPIEESIKAQALSLFASGKQAEAMTMIENVLVQNITKLDAENPEAATEYKAAEAEYASAIEAAGKEFDVEMDQIEAESKQLDADTAKQLDAVRMTELQENIQSS